MTFELVSTAFRAMGAMPPQYTCDGENISPPLQWHGAPTGTKSFALIIDDPDAPDPAAPTRTWVHWVLYNIPGTAHGLLEGATGAQLPTGAREGVNDSGHSGYDGPCPPIGTHRYFHKLYALDVVLPGLGSRPRKAELEQAMSRHILGMAELIGTYGRG